MHFAIFPVARSERLGVIAKAVTLLSDAANCSVQLQRAIHAASQHTLSLAEAARYVHQMHGTTYTDNFCNYTLSNVWQYKTLKE